MKTAIQFMLDIVEMDYNNGVEISMRVFRKMLKDSLELEKQQILSAYDAGKEQPSKSQLCPIDYYNQTFNQQP